MLDSLERLPPDPILGTIVAFRNDPDPEKVDLGVGQYKDANGDTPVFAAVRDAEERVLAGQRTKGYVAPPGDPGFIAGLTGLLFGPEHEVVASQRVGAVQTPGGSGALRVLAGLVLRADPAARLWVPDPTWGNHVPLLGAAGLDLASYPHYDQATHTLVFDRLVAALEEVGPDELVLFHGCCHNPCGADLSHAQWDVVADLADRRGFTPFIDFAYHGLGEGLDADAYGVRLLAERLPEVLVSYSASKNFGLYRERTGLAVTVGQGADDATTQTSQMANIARELYSMPPAHGASIVAEILDDPALTTSWTDEVDGMRTRLNGLRASLSEHLRDATGTDEFDYIAGERGMFSFLGFTPEQVATLAAEHAVYAVPSGRINVAGVTEASVARVAAAIAAVA